MAMYSSLTKIPDRMDFHFTYQDMDVACLGGVSQKKRN